MRLRLRLRLGLGLRLVRCSRAAWRAVDERLRFRSLVARQRPMRRCVPLELLPPLFRRQPCRSVAPLRAMLLPRRHDSQQ